MANDVMTEFARKKRQGMKPPVTMQALLKCLTAYGRGNYAEVGEEGEKNRGGDRARVEVSGEDE